MGRRLKVLFCSSEVVPFAKTGGLADVSGSLPLALEKLGVEVRVVMPKYKSVCSSPLPDCNTASKISHKKIGRNIPIYFIENDKYFNRDGLYGDKRGDYPDNLERFVFFCKEVLALLKQLDFKPHIIHCNDWQTALIPIYLETTLKDDPFYKDIKTIFTIHNLAYQGIFSREELYKTGLSEELFHIEGLEFYGKLNLMKGGIIFSTFINTVSPTYSKEIQTPEFGYGLEGILAKRRDFLFGIINGLDYEVWDPSKDQSIVSRYRVNSIEKKYVNKKRLQEELRLRKKKDIPLIGLISRLADQKGLDLVAQSISGFLIMNLQFVLLGTGDEKYHRLFEGLKRCRDVSVNLKFDDPLAHRIYAGCDMFLIPSRYEPCGLGQLISLKYGTIPIVRSTGGLRDTISDFSPKTGKGNGFVFSGYTKAEFLDAIKRAVAVYYDRKTWMKLVKRGMKADFSWEQSAKRYVELYKKAISVKTN